MRSIIRAANPQKSAGVENESERRDVISTLTSQLFRIVSGPVMLLMIPLYLRADVQGFWYTFISLSALSVLADLGFTTIILEFSAHEFAHLSLPTSGILEGPREYKERLGSLLRFVAKRSLILVTLAYIIIFCVGSWVFSQRAPSNVWLVPWALYIIGGSVVFLNNIASSFLSGCRMVESVQKRILATSVIQSLVTIFAMYKHCGLYAISFGVLAGAVSGVLLIWWRFGAFMKQLLSFQKASNNWGDEILKLLWRTAISWVSGYLILQIYTPFMFLFKGPVEAGRIGISINLATTIFTISSTWMTANNPRFNMYVAKRSWEELDRAFWLNFRLSVFTNILVLGIISVIGIGLVNSVAFLARIADRFVEQGALAMLLLGWLLQLIINNFAIYLRAHKQEPIVVFSVVIALLITLATYICARYLQSALFFSGFLASYAVSVPWIVYIFRSRRKAWHLIGEVT